MRYPGVLALLAATAAWGDVQPLANDQQVNTATSLSQRVADVAVTALGAAVVVWESPTTVAGGSDASGWSIQGQRLAAGGAPEGGQFQVNVETVGDQLNPAVAVACNGRFLVAWEGTDAGGWGIKARLYEPDGQPVGGEFVVNAALQTNAQVGPDVAALPDGNFAVVWESIGSLGDDASQASIQARLVTNAGALSGSQAQVNSFITGAQTLAAVTSRAKGGFAVAWRSDTQVLNDPQRHSIRWQAFSSTAVKAGGERLAVSSATLLDAPAIAVAADDTALLLWSAAISALDASGYAVEAQLFTAAGAASGPVFLVPQSTTNDQRFPVAAVLSAGGYLVSWYTADSTGNDISLAIAMRRFGGDGVAASSEAQVNTYVDNAQQFPAVAASVTGPVWIAWESFGSAGSDTSLSSIQARRFRDTVALLVFSDGFESPPGAGTPLGCKL